MGIRNFSTNIKLSTKAGIKRKGSNFVHYTKNLPRYKKIILTSTFSLVALGGIAGAIAGALITTVAPGVGGDFISYSSNFPTTLSFIGDFSNNSGDPAAIFMTKLVEPRVTEFDNLYLVKDRIVAALALPEAQRSQQTFTVGTRTYRLSNTTDLVELRQLVEKYEAYSSGQGSQRSYGIAGLEEAIVKNKDGDVVQKIPQYSLSGANEIVQYQPGELENKGTVVNPDDIGYELKLRDDVYWRGIQETSTSQGFTRRQTTAHDYVWQLGLSLMAGNENKGGTNGANLTDFVNNAAGTVDYLEKSVSSSLANYRTAALLAAGLADGSATAAINNLNTLFTGLQTAISNLNGKTGQELTDAKALLDEETTKFSDNVATLLSRAGDLEPLFKQVSALANVANESDAFFDTSTTDSERQAVRTAALALKTQIDLVEPNYTTNALAHIAPINDAIATLRVAAGPNAAPLDANFLSTLRASVTSLKQSYDNLGTPVDTLIPLLETLGTAKVASVDENNLKSVQENAEVIGTLVNVNDQRKYITETVLGFAPNLVQFAVPQGTPESEYAERAAVLPWTFTSAAVVNTLCSDFSDGKGDVTTYNGLPLNFFDGGNYRSYATVRDLCSGYSTFYAKDDFTIGFKTANPLKVIWLMDLFSTVIFLPMSEEFVNNLDPETPDAISDIADFGTSANKYLSNGAFYPESISFRSQLDARKDETHFNNQNVSVRRILIKYFDSPSTTSQVLGFDAGAQSTVALDGEWYKYFQENRPNEIEFAQSDPVGRYFGQNALAPHLTNNYFRTKRGESINWNDPTIGTLQVEDYIRNAAGECVVQDTNNTYPEYTLDNYFCGVPQKYREFANLFRRVVSSTYHAGQASFSAFNRTFSHPAETFTPANLSVDANNKDYIDYVGDAIADQEANRIQVSTLVQEGGPALSYLENGATQTHSESEASNLNTFLNDYGTGDNIWASSRQVGISAAERQSNPVLGPDGYPPTPSFDRDFARRTWAYMQANFPAAWTDAEWDINWTRTSDAQFNNYNRSFTEAWGQYLTEATGGKVKIQSLITQSLLWFAQFTNGNLRLDCVSTLAEKEQPFDIDGNDGECARNVGLTYNGWAPDFKDPSNFLGSVGSLWPGMVPIASLPPYLIQYFADRAAEQVNATTLSDAEKAKQISELKALVTEANSLNSDGTRRLTAAQILSSGLVTKADGTTIPGLNFIGDQARLAFLANIEAWLIREGFMVPFIPEANSPRATRIAARVTDASTPYDSYSYYCDIEGQQRTRVLRDINDQEHTVSSVLPNCIEYKVIRALARSV